MTELEYRQRLEPAIKSVIKLFIENEAKHGEGLHLKPDDILACANHALSSARGKPNDCNHSHAVAAAARALKVVLMEQINAK